MGSYWVLPELTDLTHSRCGIEAPIKIVSDVDDTLYGSAFAAAGCGIEL